MALEAHAHGEVIHTGYHEPDSDHDHHHTPHPASDHSLVASTRALGKAEQLLVHDWVIMAELVLAPVEVTGPSFAWIEDLPRHPPPRLPEQPRSPPLA